MSKVKPIPEGYHTITPYFVAPDGEAFLNFLKQAFGAEERFVSRRPDGTVGHAEVKIGTSMAMLAQAGGPYPPKPCAIYMYVEDVDTVFRRAIAAGAKSISEPTDQFYGDRNGALEDPAGNQWYIGTHVEDVSSEELDRRAKQAAASNTGS